MCLGFFSRHHEAKDVAAFFGIAHEHLLAPKQIHSARAVSVCRPWKKAEEADGLVTDRPLLALAVSTADCAPVLLADGAAGVVGAVHAGWRGALAGVCEATLAVMRRHGAQPHRIRAVLGPCISQACYEVDIPFREAFASAGELTRAQRFFAPSQRSGKWLFDLAGYVHLRLQAAGVHNVESMEHCTCTEENMYFSHRRKREERGRQISAIMLNERGLGALPPDAP